MRKLARSTIAPGGATLAPHRAAVGVSRPGLRGGRGLPCAEVSDVADTTGGISEQEVARLLAALAEAERDTKDTAARFVSRRPEILEEASARRHQLVYGRRGVGKSTLLRRVAADAAGNTREVIFIDVETLRRRPYPDVLIELLSELLADLDDRLRDTKWWTRVRRRRLRRRLRDLATAMNRLLQEPQTAVHTVSNLRERSRGAHRRRQLGGRLRLRAAASGQGASVDAQGSRGRHDEHGERAEETVEARYYRTKMDGLNEATIPIREVLNAAHQELGVPTLILLDDFYHVPLDDQPEVLAYLHQVVKNL